MDRSIPTTLSVDAEGFAVVPAGLLVAIETSLERRMPPKPNTKPLPSGFQLVQPNPVDLDVFKQLFRAVGEPWLWYGRLTKSDEEILSILTAPTTTLRYLVHPSGKTVGLFEAHQRGDDTFEVIYFGLVPSTTGQGVGSAFLEHGLAAAWQNDITHAWLHTCTFDSPHAFSFYRRQGFRPFKYRVEIQEDPRLMGLLPRTVAPHIPLADFSDP